MFKGLQRKCKGGDGLLRSVDVYNSRPCFCDYVSKTASTLFLLPLTWLSYRQEQLAQVLAVVDLLQHEQMLRLFRKQKGAIIWSYDVLCSFPCFELSYSGMTASQRPPKTNCLLRYSRMDNGFENYRVLLLKCKQPDFSCRQVNHVKVSSNHTSTWIYVATRSMEMQILPKHHNNPYAAKELPSWAC